MLFTSSVTLMHLTVFIQVDFGPLFVVVFVAFLMWLVVAVSWLIVERTARARAHNCGTTVPTFPLS
jgi:hypothetical protein